MSARRVLDLPGCAPVIEPWDTVTDARTGDARFMPSRRSDCEWWNVRATHAGVTSVERAGVMIFDCRVPQAPRAVGQQFGMPRVAADEEC